MPELGSLKSSGLNIRPFVPLDPSSYFDKTPVPAPIVDTREGSRIAAKGALFQAIATALSTLPDKLQDAYQKGRQANTAGAVRDKFDAALAIGDSKALEGFSTSGSGDVSYKSPANDELSAFKIESEKARAAHYNRTGFPRAVKAPIDPMASYNNGISKFGVDASHFTAPVSADEDAPLPVSHSVPDEVDAESSEPGIDTSAIAPAGAPIAFTGPDGLPSKPMFSEGSNPLLPVDFSPTAKGNNAPALAAIRVTGSAPANEPLGRITDYGQKNDPNGDDLTRAGKSAIGQLTPESMSVSRDIGAKMLEQGIKIGDRVSVQLADGSTVERVFDDRTAEGLTGRIDLYSPGGKSPIRDASVVAINPVSGSGTPLAQRQAIEGAAINIGDQLTGTEQPDLSAANESGPIPTARAVPVSQADAIATFNAAHPNARNAEAVKPKWTEENGNRVIVSPDGTRESLNMTTGIQTIELPDGQVLRKMYGGKTFVPVKKDSAEKVPAAIRAEAIRMGIDIDKKSAGEISKLMEDKQISDGIIPPHLLPQAQSLARLVVAHPTLKHYPAIREAKEAVDAGLANPDAGGFSDMALIEGFQRMVNPGAAVRTSTMSNMKEAAGWLQQLDPSYQWSKATTGDKFTPEARARLHKLSDDIFARATKAAAPQLNGLKKIAKSYGISNPDAFIDNVLVMSPLFDGVDAAGNPTAPGAAPSIIPPGAALTATNVASNAFRAAAQAMLQKYQSGGYDSDPARKAIAETKLRTEKLIP